MIEIVGFFYILVFMGYGKNGGGNNLWGLNLENNIEIKNKNYLF